MPRAAPLRPYSLAGVVRSVLAELPDPEVVPHKKVLALVKARWAHKGGDPAAFDQKKPALIVSRVLNQLHTKLGRPLTPAKLEPFLDPDPPPTRIDLGATPAATREEARDGPRSPHDALIADLKAAAAFAKAVRGDFPLAHKLLSLLEDIT